MTNVFFSLSSLILTIDIFRRSSKMWQQTNFQKGGPNSEEQVSTVKALFCHIHLSTLVHVTCFRFVRCDDNFFFQYHLWIWRLTYSNEVENVAKNNFSKTWNELWEAGFYGKNFFLSHSSVSLRVACSIKIQNFGETRVFQNLIELSRANWKI